MHTIQQKKQQIMQCHFQTKKLDTSFHYQTHALTCLRLQTGEGEFSIHHRSYPLRKDHLLLLGAYQCGQLQVTTPLIIDELQFSAYTLSSEVLPLLQLPFSSTMQSLFSLFSYYEHTDQQESAYSSLAALCMMTLQMESSPSFIQELLHPKKCQIAEAINDYLWKHHQQALSMDHLAENFHRNPSALMHLYQEVYHISIHEALRTMRLSHACELLQDGKMPIAQVAQHCGFTSSSYLIQSFHKAYQITPLQYRKQSQRKR